LTLIRPFNVFISLDNTAIIEILQDFPGAFCFY
jgi:hypothetical protein